MKTTQAGILSRCAGFAVILLLLSGVSRAADRSVIAGIWKGDLDVNGMKLGAVFKITEKEGGLAAAMDVPMQGAKDIPVEKVSFENNELTLNIPVIRGSYKGTYNETTGKISGTWEQNGMKLPLELARTDAAGIALNRPQEPKPPYPYDEEDVTVDNQAHGASLAGTLTLPRAAGPFPAAILITGSGPQNRNEELMGHKPFLVIADHLTRQNIAVLRMDDRGFGKSTGDHASATSETFATDISAALDFLLKHPKIDKTRIGLIGHSEGGLIAPMVASRRSDVAFVVMLAGPGTRGDRIILSQSQLLSAAAGMRADLMKLQDELNVKTLKIVETEKDPAKAEAAIRALVSERMKSLSDEDKKAMGYDEAMMERQIRSLLSPWFRFFLFYDPIPALEKVRCPVLALNGDKDLQVPSKENLPPIREALKKAANPKSRVEEAAGLNHLFQTAKTGGLAEYAASEETMAPSVLELMARWIREAVK